MVKYLLIWFDYIFYRIVSFYKDKLPAIFLLSLAQSANFLTLLSLIYMPFGEPKKIPVIVILVFTILFFIIVNTIHYRGRILLNNLESKWEGEDSSIKLRKSIYMILYIALSIILFVFSANISRILE
jgi:hypothetical protein